MYTLYHHFLQKTKANQIKQYNQKHRAYLIRAGKCMESQNSHTQSANQNQNQNRPSRVEKASKNPQGSGRPKRTREFNFPKQQENRVPVEQKTMPQQVKVERQQQKRSRVNQDRPIKQIKAPALQPDYSEEPPIKSRKSPQSDKPILPSINKIYDLASQFQEVRLMECGICGRKFKQEALLKHEGICEKVFQQKRKPFEVKVIDEQAELLKNKSAKGKEEPKDSKKQGQSKWKNQSEILRNFLKKGRGEKVQNEVVEQDTRILCPGCGRKFNDKAAAKHIEFCTKKPKKAGKN